jgi:methylated-DNA-[protein]-cysteine S-methyltransferase
MNYHGIIPTPCISLGYRVQDGALVSIDFLPRATTAVAARDSLGRRIESQLRRFFDSPCIVFDFPIHTEGTAFQQRVWQALRKIPPGERCTYGDLARRLGSSPRAVGGACRANPIPIVIPCHRVVAASGIGGYCGPASASMLRIKHWLLAHECAGGEAKFLI